MRIANSLLSYVRYFENAFWPVNLAAFYPFDKDFPIWNTCVSGAFLMTISGLACWQWRRRGYIATGWFWYLGTLVPVIGIMQNGDQSMADRYTYIPYVGLLISVVWGATALVEWKPQFTKPVQAISVGALVACLILASLQIQTWRNTTTLFTRALLVTKDNFTAYTIMGDTFVENGQLEKGIANYLEALRLEPALYKARHNLGHSLYLLGMSLAQQGKRTEAEKAFEESANAFRDTILTKPTFAQSHFGLGATLAAQGKYPEAIEAYRECLKLQPNLGEAMIGLGTAFLNSGHDAEAIDSYHRALQYFPQNVECISGVGMALARQGNYKAAEVEMKRALQLQDAPEIRNNLGNVLVMDNRSIEAIPHYQAAAAMRNTWAAPLNSLAWIYATHSDAKVRNGTLSLQLAQQACQLSGNQNGVYLNTLAAAYAEIGNFDLAVSTSQTAVNRAMASGQVPQARVIQKCLELFQNHQPYRDTGQ
jgi:tetratricopeptide (TPR) repeat protein